MKLELELRDAYKQDVMKLKTEKHLEMRADSTCYVEEKAYRHVIMKLQSEMRANITSTLRIRTPRIS